MLFPIARTAVRRMSSLLSPSIPARAFTASGVPDSRNASAALARTSSSSASSAPIMTRSAPAMWPLESNRSNAGVAAHSLARCTTASDPENAPSSRDTMSANRSAAHTPSRSTKPSRTPTAWSGSTTASARHAATRTSGSSSFVAKATAPRQARKRSAPTISAPAQRRPASE